MNVANQSHPLAAGKVGNVSMVNPGTTATFTSSDLPVIVGSDAIMIASTGANAPGVDLGRLAIWAYDIDDRLVDNTTTVPSRRVAFATLNADGLELFDAAVRWTANLPSAAAQPTFNPPVVSGRSLSLSWTGLGTLQVATNLTGNAADWSTVNPQPTTNTFNVQVGSTPRSYYRIIQ